MLPEIKFILIFIEYFGYVSRKVNNLVLKLQFFSGPKRAKHNDQCMLQACRTIMNLYRRRDANSQHVYLGAIACVELVASH